MDGIHVNATFTHSVVWQPFYKDRSKICAGADDVKRGDTLSSCSLVPRPPPQLSSLAVRITLRSVIRTASDDSCDGGLGTRLLQLHLGD